MSRPTESARWDAGLHADDSGCVTWVGRKDRSGYGRFWSSGEQRVVMAHRYAYEQAHGAIPEGLQVDHICHNRACVRPEHLRLATPSENKQNVLGARSDSGSGVRGVGWARRQRKWRATVRHMGTRYDLGYFTDIADAEAAVVAKRIEVFTHNDLDRRAA